MSFLSLFHASECLRADYEHLVCGADGEATIAAITEQVLASMLSYVTSLCKSRSAVKLASCDPSTSIGIWQSRSDRRWRFGAHQRNLM
ncbi:hypothetical protein COCON_G00175950 [Conger conger]|uniref:Uncharacterized protein n=1 Tax=Conger conger TaxID=82655 RepID=A0A9Q1HSH0_CONCO|nr:hypothetical protein COCON_G00175950 [Conger conger]